ncbi:MAG: hypothetical protein U1E70_11665 [Acetobacteraceae bacterium]|nr:hypothetical protein [Pseudomonadota bacterium]
MRIILLLALLIGAATPAAAQAPYRLGPDCRPLPIPGYMMAPQPPDPNCLAAQQREAEAYRRRQAAEAEAARKRREAAEAAERQRLEQLAAQCAATSADDVRATVEQDPAAYRVQSRILDITPPHFADKACRTELMTSQGVYLGVVGFRDFNGKTFLQLRLTPERQAR